MNRQRFSIKRLLTFCILLIALVILTSCTTLRGSKIRQKIASEPPGAKVYQDGEYLGETPGFFELNRAHRTDLVLKYKNIQKTYRLDGSYRWGESFLGNFIWIFIWWAPPVGWGTDILSQTAWDYHPSPTYSLLEGEPDEVKKKLSDGVIWNRPRIIAIAPPQSSYELLSDEIGRRLTKSLEKKYPKDKVLDFLSTETLFATYNYSNSGTVSSHYRDDLFYDLKATHVVETTIERFEDSIVVKSKMVDIFTDRVVEEFAQVIPAEEVKTLTRSTFFENMTSLVSLVPNTFAIDLSRTQSVIELAPPVGATYTSESEYDRSILRMLSGFAIRNSRSPNLITKLSPEFRLTTDFTFAYDRVHFVRGGGQPNNLQDLAFHWISLAFGIGPELGLNSPIGYFYGELEPGLSMNWIDWEQRGRKSEIAFGSMSWNVEIGYMLYVSRHINLRIFSRSYGVAGWPWSSMYNQVTGESAVTNNAQRNVSGFSIGYYLPEARTAVKGWLF